MSTPMNWQPSKAIQAKAGANKKRKTIPRWIENPKGRSRQKWDDERKNEKEIINNKHARSIDHRCDVQGTYVTVPRSSSTIQTVLLYNFYSFLPSALVSTYLQTTASPEEELLHMCPSASHCVPNIPMFCLSLRNCVYKLPIIMHSRAFIHA